MGNAIGRSFDIVQNTGSGVASILCGILGVGTVRHGGQ